MVDRVIAETPRRARLTRLMISPTMIDDAVTHFDAFTPDNDPYGEHDFGLVRVTAMSSCSRSMPTAWAVGA